MKRIQLTVLVVVMATAMGWWLVEARGEETRQAVPTGPIPRFTIPADTNCVVDNLTGLMWARNANLPGGTQTWAQAVAFCKSLNYGGHSDWRLPNLTEYYSLINTNYPRPRLSNTEGTAQWKEGDPFMDVVVDWKEVNGYYWASTTTVGEPAGPWLTEFIRCTMNRENDNETKGIGRVWTVRDGK